ncbi:MAG: Prolyl tripeptidyl peptidase precursor [Acidobacteria bacterium ADurb.Bin340]|nr:MAG: Prolyl tripeptidyl peptidase precursor [Acidobacteria bacterium ADurb.Bin340]
MHPVRYFTILALVAASLGAQEDLQARLKRLEAQVEDLSWELDVTRKAADDALFWLRLSDVAEIDKVILTGPPNPHGKARYGIANERHPQRIYQYVFQPKGLDKTKKHPAVVLPHGGVHGDFGTYHVHLVKEMLAKGYIVLAPEYRGSTGYGKDMYEAIDYGGLEVDDVVAGRDWAVDELSVDSKRIAIVGWSHGGLIALMASFDHPEKFACAYAGVPVSDLITRLGYHEESYKKLFAAPHHIGKEPVEAVDEYRRRSPVWNAHKLKTPLMVTSSTNDRDVNVVEVEQLITHLKAAGKTFEHKIYKDAPGGHSFDRIDTTFARNARKDLYAFLAKHLK